LKVSETLRFKVVCAKPLCIILLLLIIVILPSMNGSSYGFDPNLISRTGIEGGTSSQPNLTVQCSNSPLSPQAEQKVNIIATALSGTGQTELSVDSIEIFLNNNNMTVPVATIRNKSTLGYTFRASTDSPIVTYGCRVVDDGIPVFSGWKRMKVETRAVPIAYNGASENSLDIVYIADKDSYSGSTDPNFLADVKKANQIVNNETIFSINKDKINFWIAQDVGDARGECIVEPPANWDSAYSFAEVGIVFHRDNSIRDCALLGSEELFTTNMAVPARANITLLHEMGHRPFGLADEYDDEGGYFIANPFPNIFALEDKCREDELGRERECRTITGGDRGYFTSDTFPKDLMADNDKTQMLDDRRIQWWFDECSRNENNHTNCNNLSDTGKSIVVRLNFTDLNVAELLSTDVSFGGAHANVGNPPLLGVEVFDDSGNKIQKFNAWHPLWAFQMKEGGHEALTILPTSQGRIVTDFDRRAAEMRVSYIYSEDGEVVEGDEVISIDLRPTIRAFCEEFPDDPDCGLNPAVEPPLLPPPSPPPRPQQQPPSPPPPNSCPENQSYYSSKQLCVDDPDNCSDELDNDKDGLIDSNDSDCPQVGGGDGCPENQSYQSYYSSKQLCVDDPDNCSDELDNDKDGSADSDDPDCTKCDEGEELVDGKCQPIKCDEGEELVDGKCQPIKCDEGEELVDGKCVEEPSESPCIEPLSGECPKSLKGHGSSSQSFGSGSGGDSSGSGSGGDSSGSGSGGDSSGSGSGGDSSGSGSGGDSSGSGSGGDSSD
jgi:hypothetical protein